MENKQNIKIIWFHENPFVLFKVVSPLLSDLLEKWMTFMYQNAHLSHLTGDIYGLNALDASSNISQTYKKKKTTANKNKPHHFAALGRDLEGKPFKKSFLLLHLLHVVLQSCVQFFPV